MIFRSGMDDAKRLEKRRTLIQAERDALGTPQQNGHVKWKLATHFNRVFAMLAHENFLPS